MTFGSILAAVGAGTAVTVGGLGSLSAASGILAGIALCGVMKNVGESIVKNRFCEAVVPRRGSILKVDLAGGCVAHSGVYLGNNRIAEVTEIDGDAIVREVSPREFLKGDCPVRTGTHIYVAATPSDGDYRALASESIARRAEATIGYHGKYNLAFNNCHMFTHACITGKTGAFPTWSINRLASALRDKFGVGEVSWRSAGAVFCRIATAA